MALKDRSSFSGGQVRGAQSVASLDPFANLTNIVSGIQGDIRQNRLDEQAKADRQMALEDRARRIEAEKLAAANAAEDRKYKLSERERLINERNAMNRLATDLLAVKPQYDIKREQTNTAEGLKLKNDLSAAEAANQKTQDALALQSERYTNRFNFYKNQGMSDSDAGNRALSESSLNLLQRPDSVAENVQKQYDNVNELRKAVSDFKPVYKETKTLNPQSAKLALEDRINLIKNSSISGTEKLKLLKDITPKGLTESEKLRREEIKNTKEYRDRLLTLREQANKFKSSGKDKFNFGEGFMKMIGKHATDSGDPSSAAEFLNNNRTKIEGLPRNVQKELLAEIEAKYANESYFDPLDLIGGDAISDIDIDEILDQKIKAYETSKASKAK